ncbi:hypothetical protein ALQ84_200235 [Pseudomonas caricapapayae]|uniref:Uncharacterized protein n=1 Tax=Pseudomonas caricapapayae TaxID=46678 RepID=A0A3M6GUH3_9PSED|nr:hypothetical protein ALQ84_200235 [Pseudomonas caricapapayae]RMV96395.1 hypothetical protein ALP01_200474 [Pseudomonas caricapapayae]
MVSETKKRKWASRAKAKAKKIHLQRARYTSFVPDTDCSFGVCNDLQSKWPRPAIIAFFDQD